MKPYGFLLILVVLLLGGCTEENHNTYITSPEDWQPPVLTWLTPPESELRGTVGIDIAVQDSSGIDSVILYVDGLRSQMTNQFPYRFEVITDSLEDDDHLLEARAWDEHGNMGVSTILRVNVMNGIPEGPRLILVPDDFERIQDAINAAADYDTIRVRDGTYYETLNLFGKGIWIESENGPLHCAIDVSDGNNAVFAPASDLVASVRGFKFLNGFYTIYLADGSRVRFVNNFVISDSAESLLIVSYSSGEINNNLFSRCERSALQIGYCWGDLYNNIIQFSSSFGLWNAAQSRNPLEYGYNLLWQNENNYANFEPGNGDIYVDPMMDLENGLLLPGSPAVDAGNPEILDRNNTRSDIGPFGGPYAY